MNDTMIHPETRPQETKLIALLWLHDELKHRIDCDRSYGTPTYFISPDDVIWHLTRYMRGTGQGVQLLPKNMRSVWNQAISRERPEGKQPLPFLLVGFARAVEIDLAAAVIA